MHRRNGFRTFGLTVAGAAAVVTALAATDVALAQESSVSPSGQKVEGFQYFLAVRVEPVEGGLLIEDLMPGGPADLGGLRKGDVLVSQVGGQRFKQVSDLNVVVQAHPLSLSIIRDGKPMELTVQPGLLLLPSGEVVLLDNSLPPLQHPEPQAAPEQEPPRPPQSVEQPQQPKPEQPQPEKTEPKQPESKQSQLEKPQRPARPAESADQAALQKELVRLREHAKKLERQIAALKAQLAEEKSERKDKPEAKKPEAKKPAAKKPEGKQPATKKPEAKDKPQAKDRGAKQGNAKTKDKPRDDAKRDKKPQRDGDAASKRQPDKA